MTRSKTPTNVDFPKTVKIATHNGVFHADEVFAIAVLQIYFEQQSKKIKIIRTRDLKLVSKCHMAVDIGGKYDSATNQFDHHQKNKPTGRKNLIPYASFGLIWKHFGRKIVSNKKVHEKVENKLVLPIDALDNGVAISEPKFAGLREFGVTQSLSALGVAYKDGNLDLAFQKALEFAKLIISGEIIKAESKVKDEKAVTSEIVRQMEPEILILEKYYSWDSVVSKYKKIKLVIFPDSFSNNWCIQVAKDDPDKFDSDRISFPSTWRGLFDRELANISGTTDSVFCHAGGFFAVARSKESAIELASKTITQ